MCELGAMVDTWNNILIKMQVISDLTEFILGEDQRL